MEEKVLTPPAEPSDMAPVATPKILSEPLSEPNPEPAPVSAPKQFVREKVDIEALRRSINESLRKQQGKDAAVPPDQPPKE